MQMGVIKGWIAASLLAVLTACTTVPSSPPPGPSSPGTKVPGKPEAPGSKADAAPVSEAVADDKDLLAGEAPRELEQGRASWYGPGFHGRRTASGERYDMYALTAAHPTLPFGTLVRVRSLVTGRKVDVRINDRGPFAAGRVIDLSQAAAGELGMLGLGVKDVLLQVPESTPAVAELPPQPVKKKARRVTHQALKRSPAVKP